MGQRLVPEPGRPPLVRRLLYPWLDSPDRVKWRIWTAVCLMIAFYSLAFVR